MPSRMPVCVITHRCAKRSLIGLNIFYMLSAAILILVASCGRYQPFLTSHYLFGAVIGVGAFLICLAAAGLWGTIRHNQVVLFFYIIVLFIVFAVQFGVACSCLAMLSGGARAQRAALLEVIWTHVGDATQRDIQMSLNCCGFKDANTFDGALAHPNCHELSECAQSTAPCCIGLVHESTPVRRDLLEQTAYNTTPIATTVASIAVGQKQPRQMTNSNEYANITCPVSAVCEPLIDVQVNAALRLVGGLGVLFALFEFAGLFLTYRYRNMRDPRLYERATKAWGTDLLRSNSESHATLEIS